jgi:hypothetical protein
MSLKMEWRDSIDVILNKLGCAFIMQRALIYARS